MAFIPSYRYMSLTRKLPTHLLSSAVPHWLSLMSAQSENGHLSVNNSTLLHLNLEWLFEFLHWKKEVLALCCVSQQKYVAVLVLPFKRGKNIYLGIILIQHSNGL